MNDSKYESERKQSKTDKDSDSTGILKYDDDKTNEDGSISDDDYIVETEEIGTFDSVDEALDDVRLTDSENSRLVSRSNRDGTVTVSFAFKTDDNKTAKELYQMSDGVVHKGKLGNEVSVTSQTSPLDGDDADPSNLVGYYDGQEYVETGNGYVFVLESDSDDIEELSEGRLYRDGLLVNTNIGRGRNKKRHVKAAFDKSELQEQLDVEDVVDRVSMMNDDRLSELMEDYHGDADLSLRQQLYYLTDSDELTDEELDALEDVLIDDYEPKHAPDAEKYAVIPLEMTVNLDDEMESTKEDYVATFYSGASRLGRNWLDEETSRRLASAYIDGDMEYEELVAFFEQHGDDAERRAKLFFEDMRRIQDTDRTNASSDESIDMSELTKLGRKGKLTPVPSWCNKESCTTCPHKMYLHDKYRDSVGNSTSAYEGRAVQVDGSWTY